MSTDPKIIFQLSDKEKKWWKETIKSFRDKHIHKPEFYAQFSIKKNNIQKTQILSNPEQTIKDLRETAWARYLQDECEFHKEAISYLITDRKMPRDILEDTIEANMKLPVNTDNALHSLAPVIGNYTGRIMPYVYEVSLSTTQSRRSRAGNTFEKVIENILSVIDCPYDNQSALGTSFYKENNLGKMVDAVVPSKDHYLKNRTKCMMLTMKTTLRERWQEVVEELQRTNMPHIYLLTIDEDVSGSVVETLSSYNITLVIYDSVYEKKFAGSGHNNIIGYKTLFNDEIRHNLSYWKID